MEIKTVRIADLKPADYNPRTKSAHVLESVKDSIHKYGWLAPVIYNTHKCDKCGDRNMVIVGGHRRLEGATAEGLSEAPAVAVNLHIEDEKELNLKLNAQERFKQQELAQMISEINERDPVAATKLGFSAEQIVNYLFQARYQATNGISGILQEKFLIPPFSILDSKQGYWQDRKKKWVDAFGDLAETRESKLAGSEGNLLMRGLNQGVSIFDPVVTELMYLWFAPEKGRVLDPFAGALSRGGVIAAHGGEYTGIEIRKEQIVCNERGLARLGLKGARYIHSDAKKLNEVVAADDKYDLILACPPYYDLEIYSDGEGDLSAKQTYEEFMKDYEDIFSQAASHLKDNRFLVIVLGDIRDPQGMYRNFLGDNIALFKRLGFELYNELIYVQMLATAPHRAARNMKTRKVVKTHQNIYTFYKGDAEMLKNPRLLEVHQRVLTFFRGDTDAIERDFKNPPQVKSDIVDALMDDPSALE